jgi:hypothetical protein
MRIEDTKSPLVTHGDNRLIRGPHGRGKRGLTPRPACPKRPAKSPLQTSDPIETIEVIDA